MSLSRHDIQTLTKDLQRCVKQEGSSYVFSSVEVDTLIALQSSLTAVLDMPSVLAMREASPAVIDLPLPEIHANA